MAVQTEEVRDLVDFLAPEGFVVTSFYLDVNAGEFPSDDLLETSFDSTIHTAESVRKEIEETMSHDARESVRDDLAKIRDFMKGLDRQDTNGIAIFSCSAHGLWEVFQMPTHVESRIEFGPKPYVAPLAAFLSHTKPTAILVTDKQNARIFTMKHGEVREWTSFEDYVPQRSSQGGWSQMRYQRRSDNFQQHHIDKGAELVFELDKHYPFDWLIIGTQQDKESQVVESLHPYVKDRVIGFIHVRIDADQQEVLDEARRVREEAESHLLDDLVNRIQEYAGAGGKGTIGLKETLQALNEQKVHILAVEQGAHAPGGVCPNCGFLTLGDSDTCPACSGQIEKVDNVVDLAIQRAMELGAKVEVATELEKLKPIENVGAVLYY
jgi:peptide subunit release factor 1 (eRF1)